MLDARECLLEIVCGAPNVCERTKSVLLQPLVQLSIMDNDESFKIKKSKIRGEGF